MSKISKLKIHPLLAVACVVIIVAGMQAIAPVLNLFLVALLFAVSILPVLTWQLKRGWSRTLALSLTTLLIAVIGASLAAVLGLAINNVVGKIPFYKQRVTELYQSALTYIESIGIKMEDIESLELLSPDRLFSIG